MSREKTSPARLPAKDLEGKNSSNTPKTSLPSIPIAGLVLLCVFLLARAFTEQIATLSLPNAAQDFIILSSSIIIEATPFVLLGIVFSILVQVWLPENFLFKILPKHPVPRRMVLSCFGIFMPVCECGNLPLARGLMMKGLSLSDALVFLIAAPILNPVTIITTWIAFGGDTTILFGRLLGGFLIANVIGWLYSLHKKPEELLTEDFAKSCSVGVHDIKPEDRKQKSLDIFKQEANIIMPALLVGASIAGGIQVFTPREILFGVGGHVIFSVVAMIFLAFIVSICASVDAFFALAFSTSFTAGSLVAFLVFGPIIDIKMLSMMRTTYKPHVLITMLGVTFIMSLGLGLVINYAF